MRLSRALLIAGGLTALLAAPAHAVDAGKPSACGMAIADPVGDNVDLIEQTPHNLDIKQLFVKHDPAKGDDATTVNLVIADLHMDLPPGATGLNWNVEWLGGDGVTRFVRAVRDITGSVVFEHGELVAPPADGAPARYEYRGATTGAMFEGENGVIQIVVPKDPDGALNKKLSRMYATASEGRQVVPNALTTPTRGLSSRIDRAPDGEAFAPEYTVKATVGCVVAAPAPAPSGTAGAKADRRAKASIRRGAKSRRAKARRTRRS